MTNAQSTMRANASVFGSEALGRGRMGAEGLRVWNMAV